MDWRVLIDELMKTTFKNNLFPSFIAGGFAHFWAKAKPTK